MKKERQDGDDYVELEAIHKHHTEQAVLVLVSEEEKETWVPRSVLSYSCDLDVDDLKRNDEFSLKLRLWFVRKKGWSIR